MGNLPSHYRSLRDGRIQDLRYRYSRGTPVKVVSGPHSGLTGRVESATFDRHAKQPGYHVQLSNQRWACLAWDQLEMANQFPTSN